jgi:glutathione S-transferase
MPGPSLVLHHAWKSSASRRVRLCLEEKGLAYEGRVVDMAALEHHSPEYLRINPHGVVPTLIHDGRPLHESGTICEYLDEIAPDPGLVPGDAYGRALMRNWIRDLDAQIGHLIVFNWARAFGAAAAAWSDEELAARLARVPSRERREAWRRVARRPYTEEERGEARARLVALLDRMENAARETGWLVGGRYSLADVAAVPFVARIAEEIAPQHVTAARRPAVARWWARIQARPAFARAGIGPFADADATQPGEA